MKIILSPAKKMNIDTDTMDTRALPAFLDRTAELMHWLRELSFAQAQRLWACNEKIAQLNFERFASMDLERNLTPALLSYEGIQYQYMAPRVFENAQWDYVQEHLRILSGFYGILRPFDGVVPYRLEMQAKGAPAGYKDLYDFWGGTLYEALLSEEHDSGCRPLIINLASKEYSRCVENYLRPDAELITCVFGELSEGKVIQKGTMAKMARGEMVRFMAERRICSADGLREFDRLGYRFCRSRSSEKEYVFIKEV